MKIRKGDKVKVIYGKEKGKDSVVEKAFPKVSFIIVSDVNVVKKHTKPNNKNKEGGIISVTKKIPASRVLLICPKCSKPTRVKYYFHDNKRFRQCANCKEVFK